LQRQRCKNLKLKNSQEPILLLGIYNYLQRQRYSMLERFSKYLEENIMFSKRTKLLVAL
jgi:hypothetical protein